MFARFDGTPAGPGGQNVRQVRTLESFPEDASCWPAGAARLGSLRSFSLALRA